MSHYNNEDAGDLSAAGAAGYCESVTEDAHYAGRSNFVQAFDRDMSRPVGYSIKPEGKRFYETVHVSGPRTLPCCEQCSADLARDHSDALFCDSDGIYYCGPDCREAYRNSSEGFYEPQEDFGADNNGPIGDWWYGD